LRLQNEALAAAKHEADVERRRYHDLFEFAPDGYIVTDALGNIREANRAAGRLLNAAAKNLVGKPLVVFIAPDERQFFHAELTRLSRDKHAQAWNLCLHPRDREPIYVAATVAGVTDERNEVISFRWLLRDYSALRRAEER